MGQEFAGADNFDLELDSDDGVIRAVWNDEVVVSSMRRYLAFCRDAGSGVSMLTGKVIHAPHRCRWSVTAIYIAQLAFGPSLSGQLVATGSQAK